MAQRYASFSQVINLDTPEQRAWFHRELKFLDLEGDICHIEFDRNENLWIHGDGGVNDNLVELIQRFIQELAPKLRVAIEIAYWCSEPYPDAFGGSWISIVKDDIRYGFTHHDSLAAHPGPLED